MAVLARAAFGAKGKWVNIPALCDGNGSVGFRSRATRVVTQMNPETLAQVSGRVIFSY